MLKILSFLIILTIDLKRASAQTSLCPPGLLQLTNSMGQTATCTPQLPCTCEQIKPGSLCQYSSSMNQYICCGATASQCGNTSPLVSSNGQYVTCNVGSTTCGNGYSCINGICCSNGISAMCNGGNNGGQQCLTGQVMVNGVCVYQTPIGGRCQQGTTQCITGASCMNNFCQCTNGYVESNGQCVISNGVTCGVGMVSSNGQCLPLSAPGKQCSTSLQCLDKSVCNGATCQCQNNANLLYGYCIPYTGGPCQQAQTYINNQCVYYAVVGEPCIASQQCVGGSTCISNMCNCQQGYVALYGYCISQNGGGNNQCGYNQVYYNGQCYNQAKIGYACNSNIPGICMYNGICSNGYCNCPNGYTYQSSTQSCVNNNGGGQCNTNQVFYNNQCYNTASVGQQCQNVPNQCLYSSQCQNGICTCVYPYTQNGQQCINNNNNGQCQTNQVYYNGQCYNTASVGQQCTVNVPSQCLYNSQCQNGICTCIYPYTQNGQQCVNNNNNGQCQTNQVYYNGQCYNTASVGQQCTVNVPNQCLYNSQCSNGICTCIYPYTQNGQQCISNNNNGNCQSNQIFYNNQCYNTATVGQQCTINVPNQCLYGSQCNNGLCSCPQNYATNGVQCVYFGNCQTNQISVNGACMNPANVGQSCVQGQCVQNSQCINGICTCQTGSTFNGQVCSGTNNNNNNNGQCQSYQVLVGSTCMNLVSIGQQCSNNLQCNNIQNSQCNGVCQCLSPYSYNGQSCTQNPINCGNNQVYVQSSNQCQQLVQIGQFCSNTAQCMGFSQCLSGVCSCANGQTNNQGTCAIQSSSQQYQCPSGTTLIQQNNAAIFCGIGQQTCPSGSSCFFLSQQSVSVCCLANNGGGNNNIPSNAVCSTQGNTPVMSNGFPLNCFSGCPANSHCESTPSALNAYICCQTANGKKKK